MCSIDRCDYLDNIDKKGGKTKGGDGDDEGGEYEKQRRVRCPGGQVDVYVGSGTSHEGEIDREEKQME